MRFCSKNTPFLGPMAGQKPFCSPVRRPVHRECKGVIMHETETLHRNLGPVTGAFIGRRSRHCALEGAASSAEKRDEGWSCGLHTASIPHTCGVSLNGAGYGYR